MDNLITPLISVMIGCFILGSIYSLIATGLSMLWSTVGIANFAHGAILVIGAYVAWYFTVITGFPPLMVMVIPFLFLLGIACDKLLFKKIRYEPDATLRFFILTTALAIITEQMLNLVFGVRFRKIPSLVLGRIEIGDVYIFNHNLLTFVVAILALGILYFTLTRTEAGLAIRAVGQNIQESLVVGVNVERTYTLTVGIGFVLAGVAGMLLGSMYIFNATFGRRPLFLGYIIVVLGGLGSIKGTVYASFLVAIIEALITFLLGGAWGIAGPFLAMVIILIVRPWGLFGLREEVK